MIEWFLSGGVIMWPLLILALGIVALALREATRLRRAAARPEAETSGAARQHSPGTILFWGGIALLVGALGTVVGIVIMARNIAAAGEVSASLVWGGVALSLVSLVFGLVVFLVAGLLWMALDAWSRRVLSLPRP